MKKITISGYYGFGNLGDEAILAGMIHSFKKIEEDLDITVLSSNPEYTTRLFEVNAVSRTSVKKLLQAVYSCDLFISGGGSLLQDITGGKTIPFYLFPIFLAQMMGKATAVYAQGVGPIERSINKRMLKKVGQKLDFVSLRDLYSINLIRELGLNRKINRTADPVFSLTDSYLPEINFRKEFGLTSQRKIIGVSVRPWKEQEYIPELAKGVQKLAEQTEALIVIVPLNYSKDRSASEKLASLLETDNMLLPEIKKPETMISFFSVLDFLVGVRLHSLIFAAFNHVPFFGVSYDPKVEAFVDKFNQGDFVTISALPGGADLGIRLSRAWQKRTMFKSELQNSTQKFKKLNEKNSLQVLNLI